MKQYFFIILLLGGFFLPHSAQAKIIAKDKMVFKVSNTVFSLSDLKGFHDRVNRLTCIYTESLLGIIFKNQFRKSKLGLLEYRESFSSEDQKYYTSLVDFFKLYVYARSQDVRVDQNIEKFFYLMAQKNKCSLDVFDQDKKFHPKFRELVELEVFVRSRFLPTERNDRTTKEDLDKAILASKSLLISIGRQIEEELYW